MTLGQQFKDDLTKVPIYDLLVLISAVTGELKRRLESGEIKRLGDINE